MRPILGSHEVCPVDVFHRHRAWRVNRPLASSRRLTCSAPLSPSKRVDRTSTLQTSRSARCSYRMRPRVIHNPQAVLQTAYNELESAMADPIVENGIRALCIFQGISGLPGDRFVTSWAFVKSALTTYTDAAALVSTRLDEFWTDPAAPSTIPVAGFLSGVAINEAAGMEIRTYSLEQVPPREPTITNIALPAMSSTILPNEVAMCLSFFADRNLPRSRGRVYVGPLAASTGTADTAKGDLTPATNFRESLMRSALRLAQTSNPDWCVLSQADAALKPVTGGWVDDSYDTQRRRGVAPSTRLPFAVA